MTVERDVQPPLKTTPLSINGIPAILWGEPSSRLILAVHGNHSSKEDDVIVRLARAAVARGEQVLSFDLPAHGERKGKEAVCHVRQAVPELQAMLRHAQERSAHISLFACSMGAYFSLLAFSEAQFERCLFLSPVVDMARLIDNMMGWFGVSAERLQQEQSIVLPIGETLFWDYYRHVKDNPVLAWPSATAILYGSADELCARECIDDFCQRFAAALTVLDQAPHYFNTPGQLAFFEQWLVRSLAPAKDRVSS